MAYLDLALTDKIYLENDFECAIQELDILLNTECTEVIGDTKYGFNFYQFLWDLHSNAETIREYILDRIYQYSNYLLKFNVDVSVDYIDDDVNTNEPYYYVRLILADDNGNAIEKKYTLRNNQ